MGILSPIGDLKYFKKYFKFKLCSVHYNRHTACSLVIKLIGYDSCNDKVIHGYCVLYNIRTQYTLHNIHYTMQAADYKIKLSIEHYTPHTLYTTETQTQYTEYWAMRY